jgi:hypothetical protein
MLAGSEELNHPSDPPRLQPYVLDESVELLPVERSLQHGAEVAVNEVRLARANRTPPFVQELRASNERRDLGVIGAVAACKVVGPPLVVD